jgi:hypothetical protein
MAEKMFVDALYFKLFRYKNIKTSKKQNTGSKAALKFTRLKDKNLG